MNNKHQRISFFAKKKRSVRTTMLHVMAALVPGTVLYFLVLDSRIFFNLFLACTVALCCEYVCLRLRGRPVLVSLSDGSTVLAAWLLILCLPPSLPAWQIAIGVIVLVTLGKHMFGGLGQNPFNPAMVAYAFLLISFPVTMTAWDLDRNAQTTHKYSNTAEASALSTHFRDASESITSWDGVTGATALDRLKELGRSRASNEQPTYEVTEESGHPKTAVFNNRYERASEWIMRSPWVWTNLAWLLGGLYLLMVRIITWHIPASILLTVVSCYTVANVAGLNMGLPIVSALLSGGILLGAFFIATDPVSAAASRQGQMIYGFGIGILIVIIREYSVYPEGVAFAVLLMNMCVPLIDYISTGKRGNLTSRRLLK